MPYEPAAKLIVPIRLFAKILCKDEMESDWLVKETLKAAIRGPQEINGTTIQVHLLSIMREMYSGALSDYGSKSREPDDHLGCLCHVDSMTVGANGGRSVEAAIRVLPIHLREAVALVMVLDLSVAEAATVIGCDEESVSKRVDLAQNFLKRKLL